MIEIPLYGVCWIRVESMGSASGRGGGHRGDGRDRVHPLRADETLGQAGLGIVIHEQD